MEEFDEQREKEVKFDERYQGFVDEQKQYQENLKKAGVKFTCYVSSNEDGCPYFNYNFSNGWLTDGHEMAFGATMPVLMTARGAHYENSDNSLNSSLISKKLCDDTQFLRRTIDEMITKVKVHAELCAAEDKKWKSMCTDWCSLACVDPTEIVPPTEHLFAGIDNKLSQLKFTVNKSRADQIVEKIFDKLKSTADETNALLTELKKL